MKKYKITLLCIKEMEIEAEDRESAEDEAVDRMKEDQNWKLSEISVVCLGEVS